MKRLGLDIGSTTLKCAVLDEADRTCFTLYRRHLSRIPEVAAEIFGEMAEKFPGEAFSVTLSGSAGMGIAEAAGLPFVQEVYAEKIAVNRYCPGTDVVIELGGEDAKILFLSGGFEMRMNGTCAGGTGAFIDQMAALLGTDADIVMRPIEEDVDRSLLSAAIASLSPREKQIITMRFGLGGRRELTQKEVADRLGISQSYISRLEKRIILRLRREILKMS